MILTKLVLNLQSGNFKVVLYTLSKIELRAAILIKFQNDF